MTILLYTAILCILFLFLSFKVIGGRRHHKIALGMGNTQTLEQRIRAHGNFVEYVPMALFSLFLLEYHHVSIYLIHILGIILVLGRLMHMYSLLYIEQYDDNKLITHVKYRVKGMQCTFAVIATSTGVMLYYYVYNVIGF